MSKFFLPQQKGTGKERHHNNKKKKEYVNCNESLANDIFRALKKQHTRQIQKTIRKIREESGEESKKVRQERLQLLKSLTKPDLRKLALHVIHQQLQVDEGLLNKLAVKSEGVQNLELSKASTFFFELIKNKNIYKTVVEDAQKLRNRVNQKKKIKKQRAKERAKQKRVNKIHQNGESKQEQDQQKPNSEPQSQKMVQQIKQNKEQFQTIKVNSYPKHSQLQKKRFFERKVESNHHTFQERTEFKKTGRNKALQQKRDKRKRYPIESKSLESNPPIRKTEMNDKPMSKFQRLNQGQILHPSWQAKRVLKNQMFIQPFEGKKTLL